MLASFLPYTIDFEADAARTTPPDGSDTVLIEGRLADLHRQARARALSLTPGATTENEKIFKPFYAARSAADEPDRPAPTEVPVESWGSSRKFNQPLSKATNYPGSSILSGPAVPSEKPAQTDYSDSEDSNRRVILSDVDWIVKSAVQGNGGLRNAINAAVREDIVQEKVWVGTLGMPTDLLKSHTRENIANQLEDEYDSLTVFVSDSEFEGHYFHYCRNILYPAFHYQMQESPRNKDYDEHSWNQYVKLNEHFADAIASKWKPGDRIWIHDYHLMLLPGLLRRRLGDVELGFFMHTAFTSSEVFRCLTHRTALLEGLLGARLIGLQTGEYVYHFLHTVTRILGLEVPAEGIHLPDRIIPVKAFPMGVDNASLDTQRNSIEVKNWEVKISEKYKGKRLIVARDRLDAAGGIKQKLLAYEQFLKRYPEWRESVSSMARCVSIYLTRTGRAGPGCLVCIGGNRPRGSGVQDCNENQLELFVIDAPASGAAEAGHFLCAVSGLDVSCRDIHDHQSSRRHEPVGT
jgi:trehalose 6-phosphate synthase/phosphatase